MLGYRSMKSINSKGLMNSNIRPRRRRLNDGVRQLVAESNLTHRDLIAPLFVTNGKNLKEPIPSMPGQFRFSLDLLLLEVQELVVRGIPCVSLFPALDDKVKTPDAQESWNKDGLFPMAIREIKNKFPNLLVMTDVAMDPYSSDGHDGLVDPRTGEILNDQTLDILGKMALCQAEAGSDILGPSDMMDFRVGHIRQCLDEAGFQNKMIMSYTAKYASAFYGPFRDALDSAPKSGDKKTYQMDPRNRKEALQELELDIQEGADILMVKPGLAYLDILREMRNETTLPLAAYNVSGTYSMVKAAAEKGWIDEDQVTMEILTSFKRAGADMILTYFSKSAAELLNNQ